MRTPVLVIAGAAGAGKSTSARAIAEARTGIVAIDGDVIAAGSKAAERRDYVGFWGYTLTLAAEIAGNGLVPLVSCLCRPAQILANDLSSFSHLSLLALVCDPRIRRARVEARDGRPSWRTSPEDHDAIDAELRRFQMAEPHEYQVLNTTFLGVRETTSAAVDWAQTVTSAL